MKGYKIEFEFVKKEGFSKEALEKKIRHHINDKKDYQVVDIWCLIDKNLYIPDFPAMVCVNECTVELECANTIDAEEMCKEIEKFILAEGQQENSIFKINSINHSNIVIRKENNQMNNKDVKVFVTGVAGQLGHDVMNRLYKCGYSAIGSDRTDKYQGIQDASPVTQMPYIALDITDRYNVREILMEIRPDIIIHCAAWNAVDQADEKYKVGIVRATNASGTQSIAEVCAKIDCKMVYISTDYVFDGSGNEPWGADSKALRALNVYGQTKLEGELAVSQTLDKYFIVRTSWAYGISGKNFVKAMLNVSKKYSTVSVVNDQIGTPTYMKDLSRLIVDMIETNKYGYYNATNEGGYVSWYDFACEIFKQAGVEMEVLPVNSSKYDASRAVRPANSRLDKSKLEKYGFNLLPDWKDALGRYLEELKKVEAE